MRCQPFQEATAASCTSARGKRQALGVRGWSFRHQSDDEVGCSADSSIFPVQFPLGKGSPCNPSCLRHCVRAMKQLEKHHREFLLNRRGSWCWSQTLNIPWVTFPGITVEAGPLWGTSAAAAPCPCRNSCWGFLGIGPPSSSILHG